MRNVLDVDDIDIITDQLLKFDLKGVTKGRKVMSDPRKILNIQTKEDKEYFFKTTLKDLDFFNSLQKFDISNTQAQRILCQLEEDTRFLSQKNFMDYSLLVFVVVKPYHNIQIERNLTLPPRIIKRPQKKDKFADRF